MPNNRHSDFDFHPFAPEHIDLMYDWLRRPHVAEWWDSPPSRQDIIAEYVEGHDVRAYVVYRDGVPIGFIQSYVAMESGDGWWPSETDPGVLGIDQFIGEAELVGRGIGTAMIRAFVTRLFDDPRVTCIQTDPSPENRRAIRCYEKVGFRGVGIVKTPDGPAWYMTLDRDGLRRAAAGL